MTFPAFASEAVAGGVLCVAWLLLLAGSFVDVRAAMAWIERYPVVGLIVVSVCIYVIGAIFDRAWARVLQPVTRRVERRFFPVKEDLRQARRRVFSAEGRGVDHINYIRSGLRIARAATCNFPLLTGAGALYYIRRGADFDRSVLVAIMVGGIFFCLVSLYAFVRISGAYFSELKLFGMEQRTQDLPVPVSRE